MPAFYSLMWFGVPCRYISWCLTAELVIKLIGHSSSSSIVYVVYVSHFLVSMLSRYLGPLGCCRGVACCIMIYPSTLSSNSGALSGVCLSNYCRSWCEVGSLYCNFKFSFCSFLTNFGAGKPLLWTLEFGKSENWNWTLPRCCCFGEIDFWLFSMLLWVAAPAFKLYYCTYAKLTLFLVATLWFLAVVAPPNNYSRS